MGRGRDYPFLPRKHADGQVAHTEVLNVSCWDTRLRTARRPPSQLASSTNPYPTEAGEGAEGAARAANGRKWCGGAAETQNSTLWQFGFQLPFNSHHNFFFDPLVTYQFPNRESRKFHHSALTCSFTVCHCTGSQLP